MHALWLNTAAPIAAAPLCYGPQPVPEPGPGEVRVKVRCCGICRTDLHVIEGDLPAARRPIIPGHQVVGVVDRLGPDCRQLSVGERIGIAWLRHTCGRCRYCTSGRENLCESSRFTGYHEHGGYAEYAVAPEEFVYRLPESISDLEAAPLLCAGIIGYRSLQRARVPEGGTLALYGFGSSAHIVLQLAQARGCRVYVITRGAKHRELAERMGAVWTGATANDLPVRVDSAILFAPAGELVPSALEHLDKGGTLSIAGIHLSDIPSLRYEQQLFYERTLCSVTANTREDGEHLLREAAAIPIRPQVTAYPLADANRALLDLKNDAIAGTGVLVVDL